MVNSISWKNVSVESEEKNSWGNLGIAVGLDEQLQENWIKTDT